MNNNNISCLRLSDFNPKKLTQLNNYSILYFTRGKGQLTIDFNQTSYQKDSIFLISKNQLLEYNYTKEDDGFIIQISSTEIELLLNSTPFLNQRKLFNYWINKPKPKSTNENFYSIILSLYKECKTNKDLIDLTIIKNTLTGLLLKIHKSYSFDFSKNKSEGFVNYFKYLVDNNINFTRNTLYYAEKLGISYKHLNSVCKQQISKTAKDFIIDNTILEIKRQQALGLSTNQVSRKLGFDEPTNFVKFRKKHLV